MALVRFFGVYLSSYLRIAQIMPTPKIAAINPAARKLDDGISNTDAIIPFHTIRE